MASPEQSIQISVGQPSADGAGDRARVLGQIVSNDSPALLKESMSTFLADLIARMYDLDPTESHFQLYDHVEPDAVDALFEHARRHDQTSWRLELDVGEETIVIDSDGYVSLD